MKQKSFTLIELLVVIVIIGILAGVIMISTSSSIEKANFAKAKTFDANIKDSMMLNLVSEWNFDEGNGVVGSNATNSDVRDGWGSNHGDITSHAPILTDNCIYGKCLQFNGSNYVSIEDDVSTRLSSVTISTWVNVSTQSTPKFLSKRNGSSFYFLGLSGAGDQPYLGIGPNSPNVLVWDQHISLNNWHFIVGTFDEVTDMAVLYVDGISKDLEMTGSIGNLEGRPVLIGASNDAGNDTVSYLRGTLDGVRLYSESLSSAEIKKEYLAGLNSLLAKGNISKQEYNQRINDLSSSNISTKLP